METKHTPGPWLINPDCEDNVMNEEGYSICDIPVEYSSIPSEQFKPNALLISAAPELLEALVMFRNHVGGSSGISLQTILHCADAAIAKAKGEV